MYFQTTGHNETTDVVVVGTGPGGLAAVGSAVEHGAKVVAIEAHKDIGGNGTWSTGWVAFVNSQLQRDNGVKDSVDLFMKYCEKLIDESKGVYGLNWDPAFGTLYAQESSQLYDILVQRGVKFSRLIKRPVQTSVPRLAAVESTDQFARAFEPDFAGPNVRTYVNSTAIRLLTKDSRVVGVRVQQKQGDSELGFNVFAKKAVILATGGYQANSALRQRYGPTVHDAWYPGLPTCRGDGHLLGQAIGGDLINMTMIPPIIAVASALTDKAIAVNSHGLRFHDEAGPYQYRVEMLKKQPAQVAHYIFDNATAVDKKNYVNQLGGKVFQAQSLEELAALIEVPAGELAHTIRKWNQFVTSGEKMEPATKRVDFTPRPISEAPFFASRMIPAVSLTCGGFRTTLSMQVIDIFGQPMPGLFAVGDVAGGLTLTAEMGGTHLGGGFVHGWRAGKAAATGIRTSRGGRAKTDEGEGVFGHSVPQRNVLELKFPIITVATAEQAAGPRSRL